MGKFNWQNGTLVTPARVEINGEVHDVTPEQYSGQTPLSAENMNAMQDGIYEDIDKNTASINALKYNLVTNGEAVKTGRMVDGKDEYVKRYKFDINSISGQQSTRAQGAASLGFVLTSVTVVEMKAYIVSNTNNVFSVDTNNYNLGDSGKNYILLNANENKVTVNCNSENFNNHAVVDIYYINNN